MKIESFKDLEKLIKLCRKTGVEAIEVDGVSLNLGQEPKAKAKFLTHEEVFAPEENIKIPQYTPVDIVTADDIKTDELTEEQKLMWSVQNESEA